MTHESPGPAPTASLDPRITLIVDHPIRDLPGLVLTALSLCRRGVPCSLLPYNNVWHELAYQAPDLVVLPHYRRFIGHLVQALRRADIDLAVLDTEGGVLDSLEGFGDWLMREEGLRGELSAYCCWGPVLADYLVSARYFRSDQVHVTGCPRTDFYSPELREAAVANVAAAAEHGKSLILLNSNYCLGNPGIKSVDEQLREMVDLWELDEETARAWHETEKRGLEELVAIANGLARRFPEATVVYRPHPFERLATYEGMLEPLPNLHCLREGSVDAWLHHARVVIQRSCSTAIEAGMVGTPALSPSWLPASFERPAANLASVPCASMAELEDAVGKALAGTYALPQDVAANVEKTIADWYRAVDGQASERLADVLLDVLRADPALRRRREGARRREVYRTAKRRPLRRKYWRSRLLASMRRPPGSSLTRRSVEPLHTEVLDAWRGSPKHFGVEAVRSLVDAVLACRGDAPDCVEVRGARPQDYLFDYEEGTGVTLAPAGAWSTSGR